MCKCNKITRIILSNEYMLHVEVNRGLVYIEFRSLLGPQTELERATKLLLFDVFFFFRMCG